MSDVEGWWKRQQQELARTGLAPEIETPWVVNYRHGTDGGFEVTLVADSKFMAKPLTKKQLASLIHHLTGLLASEIDA